MEQKEKRAQGSFKVYFAIIGIHFVSSFSVFSANLLKLTHQENIGSFYN